jgi:hypothetical protein
MDILQRSGRIFRGKGWYNSLGEAGAKGVVFEGVEEVSAEC